MTDDGSDGTSDVDEAGSTARSLPIVTTDRLADASPAGSVGGVVLAAGTSSRFGAANKLLAAIDGEAIVRHATVMALASALDEIVVVVGHDERAVREALAGLDVAFVTNEDYAAGQSSSVRAGVMAARERDWDAAVFVLGDMPAVDPDSIDRLLCAYAADRGTILAAAYERTRGNPTLFDATHFDALAAVEGDTGGRALLRGHDDAALVETHDPGVVRDVDRRDDLDRFE